MPEATTTAATTTATTAAATTTDTTTQQQTQTTQQQAHWSGYTEAADLQYVEKKGWQGPADLMKSYREAEKYIGRDPSTLVTLPRADDAEGQRALFAKLGMPEKADAYDYKVGLPKDAKTDDLFGQAIQGMFHKAGLTLEQGKTLAGEYNAFALAAADKAAKDYEASVASDRTALQEKWRGGHDRMMSLAKSAATNLGFDQSAIDAMERHYGYAKTYEMFAEMGKKLGEDTLVTGDSKRGFEGTMTPAEAQQQIKELRADPAHVKALSDSSHPGHKLAQEKETKLFRIAYPEGSK